MIKIFYHFPRTQRRLRSLVRWQMIRKTWLGRGILAPIATKLFRLRRESVKSFRRTRYSKLRAAARSSNQENAVRIWKHFRNIARFQPAPMKLLTRLRWRKILTLSSWHWGNRKIGAGKIPAAVHWNCPGD